MLNKLIEFVLTQRVFVLLLTAALAVFGYRALTNLPIEAFPDVQDVQVQIITQYPGQAPEEVERTVTLPIEREMSGVPRQIQLRSVTITGLSVVTLTFQDGTDDYFARQQVLEKLQEVTLPTGIQPSLAPLSTAVGEIFRYIVEAPADMPENEIRSLQDWVIRPKLRIVPGVADVVSFGGTVKEYQVRIDPYALKRYGVTIDQVRSAVADNSANVGGGTLRRGDEALVIRGIGIFRSLEDIARAVVTAKNGKTVLVSDVAKSRSATARAPASSPIDKGDSVVEGHRADGQGRQCQQGRGRGQGAHRAGQRQAAARRQDPRHLRPYRTGQPYRADGGGKPADRRWPGDRDPGHLPAQLARGADRGHGDSAVAAVRLHHAGRERGAGQPDLAGRGRLRHHHRQRRDPGGGADGARWQCARSIGRRPAVPAGA